MTNEFVEFADDELKKLKKNIDGLEKEIDSLKNISAQLAINANWTNEQILSQIKIDEKLLDYFRE